MEISFSGSGWLSIYQLGVARTLQLAGFSSENVTKRFIGCSGGAIAATALAVGTDTSKLLDFFLDKVDFTRNHPIGAFQLRNYLQSAFEATMFDSAEKQFHDHSTVTGGRLELGITKLPEFENIYLKEFRARHELEEALIASCAVFPIAGLPFKLNREWDADLHRHWVMDGGLTDIFPAVENPKESITITAFSHWKADIRPSKTIPINFAVVPGSRSGMEAVYYLGLNDALKFLQSESQRTKLSSYAEFLTLGDELRKLVEIENGKRNSYEPDYLENFLHSSTEKFLELVGRNERLYKKFASAAVLAELTTKSAINLGKGMISLVEARRRKLLSPSKHFFSIRRWLPSEFLGTPKENFHKILEDLDKIRHVQCIRDEIDSLGLTKRHRGSSEVSFATDSSVSTDDEVPTDKNELCAGTVENSLVYRYLLHPRHRASSA